MVGDLLSVEATCSTLQLRNLLTVLLVQCEVEAAQVLLSTIWVGSLRNDCHLSTNVPLQHHLRWCAVVLLRNLCYHVVLQQVLAPLPRSTRVAKRCEGNHRDAVVLAVLDKLGLLQVGVQFDLVEDWLYLRVAKHI